MHQDFHIICVSLLIHVLDPDFHQFVLMIFFGFRGVVFLLFLVNLRIQLVDFLFQHLNTRHVLHEVLTDRRLCLAQSLFLPFEGIGLIVGGIQFLLRPALLLFEVGKSAGIHLRGRRERKHPRCKHRQKRTKKNAFQLIGCVLI